MGNSGKKPQVLPIVHCSNLSYKTTTDDLNNLFAEVAVPLQIVLRMSKNGGKSATVHFEGLAECEKIVKWFNYHEMHGKQINVVLQDLLSRAPADGNIFVKNLPEDLNSKDLEEVFKVFGPVVRSMVASDMDGKLLGYGYVQYKSVDSAKKALECCKSVKLGSKVLEVRLFDPSSSRGKSKNTVFTNCYVKNFPHSITRERLLEILEEYGCITSLFLPVNEKGMAVGYACANFEKPEQAAEAIENLHDKHLFTSEEMGCEEGLVVPPFYLQKAEDKEARAESLHQQMEKLSLGGQPAKCNLYVSNIPDTFTQEEIKNIFVKFGNIVDFKVSACATGTGRMYGYVCYSTPEEACVAFEKIDGSYLDGCKLQISYYKNKQERMRQAESRRSWGDGMGGRNSQELYNIVLEMADSYKSDWESIGVDDSGEFAQKIVKGLGRQHGKIKNLIKDEKLLDEQIREVIARMAEKGSETRFEGAAGKKAGGRASRSSQDS